VQRVQPVLVLGGSGGIEQRPPPFRAVERRPGLGLLPAARCAGDRLVEVGVAALAHRVGGPDDRRVADVLRRADAVPARLALDQGPERVAEADGGGFHRHAASLPAEAISHSPSLRSEARPEAAGTFGHAIALGRR
jgi:hypothetical protein